MSDFDRMAILKKGREDRIKRIDKEYEDRIGTKINDLTILAIVDRCKNNRRRYKVECKCGKVYDTNAQNILSGKSKRCASCAGRLASPGEVHGFKADGKREQLYNKWVNMKMACNNPNYKDYKYYGHRGITVCKTFEEYASFRKWAHENEYEEGSKLIRRNKAGNFTPENCYFSINGKQKYMFRGKLYSIEELITKTGSKLTVKTIRHRLDRKWRVVDALLQPMDVAVRNRKRRIDEDKDEYDWRRK